MKPQFLTTLAKLTVGALSSLAVIAAVTSCGARGSHKMYSHASPQAMMSEPGPASGEEYDAIAENNVISVATQPVSTFSIDVDTAAYSNVRRILRGGALPPADAVRTEELINYFSYAYPQPSGPEPFAVITEVGQTPWNPATKLVHIGLQGRHIDADNLPARNLVFLLDVSGSMASADKLPLLLRAFKLLVTQLGERDHVSIVVYAGASGVVLEPTSGADQAEILSALSRLEAGGSTNGGAGIELAYKLAEQNFQKGAINRVILATDGDFNVGVSDRTSLLRLVEAKRKTGVYLTVLGFGSGNLKDSTMEQLADNGNGNYAYIDNDSEARKVLGEQAGSTLVTIAEDVKIQVVFNPKLVTSYRLIGYENRLLENRDFNDDSKDAGDIGAGHTVTALYEIVSAGNPAAPVEATTTKSTPGPTPSGAIAMADDDAVDPSSLLTVKLRYKAPGAPDSQLLTRTVFAGDGSESSESFRFSAAVAEFAMLLRGSKHAGEASYASARELAASALGSDPAGRRRELLELIAAADRLTPPATKALAQ